MCYYSFIMSREGLEISDLDPERVKDLVFSAKELDLDLQTALERAIALQAATILIDSEGEMVTVTTADSSRQRPIEYHEIYKLLVRPYDLQAVVQEEVDDDFPDNIIPFRSTVR